MAAHAAVRVRTRPSWLRWSRRPAALQASAQPQEPAPADHAAPPAVRWADSPFAGRSVEIAHEPLAAPVSPAELTTLDGPPGMARPFAEPCHDGRPAPLAFLNLQWHRAPNQYFPLFGAAVPAALTWAGDRRIAEVSLGDADGMTAVFAGDAAALHALAAAAFAAADALDSEPAPDMAPEPEPGSEIAADAKALLDQTAILGIAEVPEPRRSRIRTAVFSLEMALDLYGQVLGGEVSPSSPQVSALGDGMEAVLSRIAEDITVGVSALLTAIDGRGPEETVPDDEPDGTREDPAVDAPAETGQETGAPAGDDAVPAAHEAAAGEPELAGGAL